MSSTSRESDLAAPIEVEWLVRWRRIPLCSEFRRSNQPGLFREILASNADIGLAGVIDDADFHIGLAGIIDQFATSDELMVLLLAVVVNKTDFVISLARVLHDIDFRCHIFLPASILAQAAKRSITCRGALSKSKKRSGTGQARLLSCQVSFCSQETANFDRRILHPRRRQWCRFYRHGRCEHPIMLPLWPVGSGPHEGGQSLDTQGS